MLESLEECNWDFGRLPSWQPGLDADLWIWDCDLDEGFPPQARPPEGHKIIFVLDRKKIDQFHDALPVEAARMLLKPVQPNILQAILEQMIPSLALSARDDAPETAEQIKDDRDLLLQHLLEANLALQQDEQDRFNFLARTAHDLRAPLGAMLGYCGLLLDRRLGPLNPEQVSALEKMLLSTKRMTRLTNGILQISLGRETTFAPRMKFWDIQDCIHQAIVEITPLAESKRLKLHVEVTPPPEQLMLEREKIEHVLVSLLDNACRVTPSGGDVQVTAFPTFWDWRSTHMTEPPIDEERRSIDVHRPNSYRVEVRDAGPTHENGGAASRFEQGTSGSANNGAFRNGLSFSICRNIISAHKGQLSTDFSARGATFGFVLPLVDKKMVRVASAGVVGAQPIRRAQ